MLGTGRARFGVSPMNLQGVESLLYLVNTEGLLQRTSLSFLQGSYCK